MIQVPADATLVILPSLLLLGQNEMYGEPTTTGEAAADNCGHGGEKIPSARLQHFPD